MARRNYERLSALDSSFLAVETPNAHMNIGGTAIFEAGPLATDDGGVDIERIRAHVGARLSRLPRYRQRLEFVPVVNRPVWVDDPDFDLGYHVRHTSLPRPGDDRQLKRLVGQILSQPLDRERPLWESWIVEGLSGGRFALVTKVHHCMADGISGSEFLSAILDASPEGDVDDDEPELSWEPRPAPSALELLEDEVRRRAGLPFLLARRLERALRDPDRLREQVEDGVTAVWDFVKAGLRPRAEIPLNRAIGRQRRMEWLTLDLAEVKAIKNRLGGTVNDVVLAVVAGGLRRFLALYGLPLDDVEVRAAVPVSVRRPEEHGRMGNRVSAWLVPLPVQEEDAWRRCELVRDTTANLKDTRQGRAGELVSDLAELAGMELITLGARVAAQVPTHNLVITNVPGPQVPLYLLGTPMTAGFPVVPLFPNQGLGIAVFSYAGRLYWGLNADWKVLRNVRDFAEALREAFAELHALVADTRPSLVDAGDDESEPPAPPRRSRRRPAPKKARPRVRKARASEPEPVEPREAADVEEAAAVEAAFLAAEAAARVADGAGAGDADGDLERAEEADLGGVDGFEDGDADVRGHGDAAAPPVESIDGVETDSAPAAAAARDAATYASPDPDEPR